MKRALALGLVLAGGIAAAAGSANTTQRNRHAARRDAPRLLAALGLPPGAELVVSDPSRSRVLGHAPTRPGTRALVDLHRFWRVPGQPRAVLDWIESHPPAGSTRNVSGASGSTAGISTLWDGYAFAANAGESYRELVVEVAQATGGGTAVRADAQVVWVLVKPRSVRIPAGVTSIAITVRRIGKPATSPPAVTSLRKVRLIVAYVNALPIAQPGAIACPNDRGPFVELDFRAARHSAPVAVAEADGGGCGLVSLRVRGRVEPALTGGPRLVRWLQTSIGVNVG